MDGPRFERLWRRRAFGLGRAANRKPFAAGKPPAATPKWLSLLRKFAEDLGRRLSGRPRLRLVVPEPRTPVVVEGEPEMLGVVRLDARGLQRMLESELRYGAPAEADAEREGAERLRKSG